MQHADRIKSTLPSLLTVWKDICERTSQTLEIGKKTFAKNPPANIMSPGGY